MQKFATAATLLSHSKIKVRPLSNRKESRLMHAKGPAQFHPNFLLHKASTLNFCWLRMTMIYHMEERWEIFDLLTITYLNCDWWQLSSDSIKFQLKDKMSNSKFKVYLHFRDVRYEIEKKNRVWCILTSFRILDKILF